MGIIHAAKGSPQSQEAPSWPSNLGKVHRPNFHSGIQDKDRRVMPVIRFLKVLVSAEYWGKEVLECALYIYI